MSYIDRSEFLIEYKKLCEKHKCFIEVPTARKYYVMEFLYPVDEAFESTIEKLQEDLG